MAGYNVRFHKTCYDFEHSDEEYGPWHESWGCDFRSIFPAPNQYPDIASPLNLKIGDRAYVVWVAFSEGDSFGWADNKGAEAVAVFDNEEDALALKKLLGRRNEETDRGEWTYSIDFETKKGDVIQVVTGAFTGYFELVSGINIEQTTIVHPPKNDDE